MDTKVYPRKNKTCFIFKITASKCCEGYIKPLITRNSVSDRDLYVMLHITLLHSLVRVYYHFIVHDVVDTPYVGKGNFTDTGSPCYMR